MRLELLSPDGAYLFPWAKKRLAQLTSVRESTGAAKLQRQFVIDPYTVTIISCQYGPDTIRIEGGEFPSGVVLHPRSGQVTPLPYFEYIKDDFGFYTVTNHANGVIGGWKNGEELLASEFVYPLDDNDQASFLFSKDEENTDTGEFIGNPGVYGNLYWTNGKTGEDLIVLSWRGTPTRHFRLPGNIELHGFSIRERSISGIVEDMPEFTAFGTALYQGGEVLSLSPKWSWGYDGVDRCLILGAMMDANGIVYIVTQSDHDQAPETAKLGDVDYPLTSCGFYLGLWKTGAQLDGWDLVAEYPYARNGLPWFGNKYGAEFICSNGDRLTSTGSLVLRSSVNGSYVEEGESLLTFKVSFQDQRFHEYQDDAIASSSVTADFYAESTASSIPKVEVLQKGEYPLVAEDQSPPEPLAVSCNANVYVITGGVPPLLFEVYEPDSLQWSTLSFEEALQISCTVAQTCPAEDILYRVTDFCGEQKQFKTTIGLITPPYPIVVFGPDVYTKPEDYWATGGVPPYTWIYPTGCGTQPVTAQSCPNGAGGFYYSGSKQVRMSGAWEKVSDITYGDTSGITPITQIVGGVKTTEWISHGCNDRAVWVASRTDCSYQTWDGNCVSTWRGTRLGHNPSYPVPTVPYTPYGSCNPFNPITIEICNNNDCSGSPDSGTHFETYQVNNDYMANVMRRVVCQWVCTPTVPCPV